LDEDGESFDSVLGRCDLDKVFWEAEHYHYPQVKENRPDPKDRPVKKDDHAMDALRYLLLSWETFRGGPPRPPAYRGKSLEETDEGDGYTPRVVEDWYG
jgi:hypothetical protein